MPRVPILDGDDHLEEHHLPDRLAAAALGEFVRDTVAAFVVQGLNVTVTHDDTADTLTIAATGGGGGLDAEGVRDTMVAALRGAGGITVSEDDAADTITITLGGHNHAAGEVTSGVLNVARMGTGTADSSRYLRGDSTWQSLNDAVGNYLGSSYGVPSQVIAETGAETAARLWSAERVKQAILALAPVQPGHAHASTDVTDFAEAVQDVVGAMLTPGANITLNYDDAAGTLTVTGAAGGSTDPEVVRDTIAAALVGTDGVAVVHDDVADTITLSISAVTIAQVTGLQGALDGKISSVTTENIPAGSTLTVAKSGGTWPARPTARGDVVVIWKGPDPSPTIVQSGTGGMHDNVDLRMVTT